MSVAVNLEDIATKQWSYVLKSSEVLNGAKWSPNGNLIALSCYPNFVIILDGATGKEITRIDHLDFFTNCTLWIDEGQRLAAQVPQCFRVYRCDDWTLSNEVKFDAGWHTEPDIDGSGKWIASGFRVVGDREATSYEGFGKITVRNIDDWSENADFNTKQECGGVAWSPTAQLAHWDHFSRITIWDLNEQAIVNDFSLPEDRVASIAWHPSGASFVAGSRYDTTLYVYDLGDNKLTRKLVQHSDGSNAGGIFAAAFSRDGKRFVSKDSTLAGRVILWDTDTWQPICSYAPKEGGARRKIPLMAMNPDDTRLLTPNHNCTGLDVWHIT